MREPRSAVGRRGVVALVLVVGALLCAGCTPSASAPRPSASAPDDATTIPDAALVPDGAAADNLPLFAAVMRSVASSPEAVAGRAYIDALAAAGFDKGAMQVTADRTSVGDPVDSLQFSVLWQGECLVGQVGPSTTTPTALVLPELDSGGCLVGLTRPIDW